MIEEKLGRVKTLIRLIKRLESVPTRTDREERKLERYRDEVNRLDDESDEEGWSSQFADVCDY